ncbi:MAG: methyltransferase domain-containing protein [Candidatus Marinimicrobia bacterium]|nr:methyltransferase domain-containing protein [Candidatus Neomarinimicrobiota bacterium]
MNGLHARIFAHKILGEWFSGTRYLEHIMHFNDTNLSLQEKRFVEFLIYQVIIHQRLLDHIVRRFYTRKPKKAIYLVLLMGSCEILLMHVKDHAALHSAVELAGSIDSRAKGFVNAVLRKVLAFRETDWQNIRENPDIPLGIRSGFPDWLITRWTAQFGAETSSLLQRLNDPPRKMARIVRSGERERIISELERLEILEGTDSYHSDYIYIKSWQPLLDHHMFQNGDIVAQDVSAVFPLQFIAADHPESVADVCCAPGGKLTALRQYCPSGTPIHGYDLNAHRLEQVQQTLSRLGIQDIPLKQADAARDAFPEYSHILVDAPCSGFGVIRKRSDLRWRRQPEDMQTLMQRQHDILENISTYIKSGGMLVYSTCTFDEDENMGTVRRFLDAHPEFAIAPASTKHFPSELITAEGAIASFPHKHFCEGSFAIALRKC